MGVAKGNRFITDIGNTKNHEKYLVAQAGRHLSPASLGVASVLTAMHTSQGTVSRSELSIRAGREVAVDWPRLRSLYSAMAATLLLEDTLIRKLKYALFLRIVARELPSLQVPEDITFDLESPTTDGPMSGYHIVTKQYISFAEEMHSVHIRPKVIDAV